MGAVAVNVAGIPYRTVDLDGGTLRLIDQPQLPYRFTLHTTETWEQTAHAITTMIVRGAGAIGATGAAGLAQAAVRASESGFYANVAAAAAGLRATRPTAQNLFYGIQRVERAVAAAPSIRAAREAAVEAARAVADEDAACCAAIGQHGLPLIPDGARVSTHCNAGWLAFVDWGSALSPIYAAHRDGRRVHVWVDETRPRGQGARLTAWELGQEGVSHTVITDGVVGSKLRRDEVDRVIVGADRIAANGDFANKIGTYTVAVLARAHGVPFYVAAPSTTFDADCPDGDSIPIEHRSADEVRFVSGRTRSGAIVDVDVVASGSPCENPAFDVTPADLVTGFITERGVIAPSALRTVCARPSTEQG